AWPFGPRFSGESRVIPAIHLGRLSLRFSTSVFKRGAFPASIPVENCDTFRRKIDNFIFFRGPFSGPKMDE
ncbi:MAG: hypothetical protein ABSH08_16235, partial [Tepidisphaeraceae bacterium]